MSEFLKPSPNPKDITRFLALNVLEIEKIKTLRDLGRNDFVEAEKMNELLNDNDEKIADLLVLRRDGMINFSTRINLFRSEKIHPFSRNIISVEIPVDDLNQDIPPLIAESRLSSLRRKGEIKDSVEAEKLAKPYTVVPEKRTSFILRTLDEVLDIRSEKSETKGQTIQGYEFFRRLKNLEEELVIERLLALALTMPNGIKISIKHDKANNKLRLSFSFAGERLVSHIYLDKKRADNQQEVLQRFI